MYSNYPLTVTVTVLLYVIMQQDLDHVANLLSIQCNFLLGLKHLFFFVVFWLKEKKFSLKEVKEEANKLKALLKFKKP